MFLAELTNDPDFLLAIRELLRKGNAVLKKGMKWRTKQQVLVTSSDGFRRPSLGPDHLHLQVQLEEELVSQELQAVLLWLQLLCEGQVNVHAYS